MHKSAGNCDMLITREKGRERGSTAMLAVVAEEKAKEEWST